MDQAKHSLTSKLIRATKAVDCNDSDLSAKGCQRVPRQLHDNAKSQVMQQCHGASRVASSA